MRRTAGGTNAAKPRKRRSSFQSYGRFLLSGNPLEVRHRHLPERKIITGIGPVGVYAPRVRDRRPCLPRYSKRYSVTCSHGL
jgi:hypothetical protein